MKKLLTAAAVTAMVGTATFVGAGVVSAETATSSTKTDPFSSLVDKISSKFNLNKSEVQAVFDEQRESMQAEREATVKAELAQLVKDGKLTQAQADAVTAKHAEIDKEREANRASDQSSTKTDTERRTERDQHKTELDAWLKEQGIDTQYAYLVMGGGRGHGPGGPGNRGMTENSTDTTSSTSSTSSTD